MKYVVISLILFSVFVGLIPYVDARGADEPCSYLNPTKYVRDSAGNCVIAPPAPAGVVQAEAAQTSFSQARSTSEPCSYLNPAKYVRDSAGNCVIAQYDPAGVAPTQIGVSQVVPSTTTTRTLDIPSVNFSDLSAIFLLAMSAFMVYKIFGGRFRQSRIKYRPQQNLKLTGFDKEKQY